MIGKAIPERKCLKEQIYDAIANPEKVVRWFPDTVEGTYEPGHQPVFGFGEYGKNRILVVEARPYEYFAFRWIPGSSHFTGDVNTVETTLVELRIKEVAVGKCNVLLTESGFSSLPPETIEERFGQNSEGWDFMLDRLVSYTQKD